MTAANTHICETAAPELSFYFKHIIIGIGSEAADTQTTAPPQIPFTVIGNTKDPMLKKKFFLFILFLFTVPICMSSCENKNTNNSSADTWDKENLRGLNVEDTAYQNAIKKAQENMELFSTFLIDKENNGYDFYIKAKFAEVGQVEHMWLIVDSLQGDLFVATLDNVPNKLKNVKYKDPLKVAKTEVEDWIIYEKDSIVMGNFISEELDK